MCTRAINWKKKELDKIEIIKNELIRKNVDSSIITNYINEQYDIIENKYNEKIKKYELNKNNVDNNKNLRKLKKNLIKNLSILNGNVDDNVINSYAEKEYDFINYKIDLDKINFID
jgi:hypothetical protein